MIAMAIWVLWSLFQMSKGTFRQQWLFKRKNWTRGIRWTSYCIVSVFAVARATGNGDLAAIGLGFGFGFVALLIEWALGGWTFTRNDD